MKEIPMFFIVIWVISALAGLGMLGIGVWAIIKLVNRFL
ncbi:hypothetical protein LCGC14_0366020 [marine sediment metagenome]|uniref:Uncharacterized protein n=1 Tax=marine sediment metagenome TaxID=412755 RepID=A0A0F9T6V8_9ZZZZ